MTALVVKLAHFRVIELTVKIRFNPAKPSEYYLPGLIQSRLTRTWKLTVYGLMVIVPGGVIVIPARTLGVRQRFCCITGQPGLTRDHFR